MLLYKDNKRINLDKIENENKNILEIEGVCCGQKMRIVLTYFDVVKGDTGKKRNEDLRKDIERIIGKVEDEALIILGDFNACTKMLNEENKKKLDNCGKRILSSIDEFNLTILNLEDNCEGVNTWPRGNLNSVVD